MKIGSLLLLFLTLVVVAYNYQFHNIPSSMYLNAYKLPERGFCLALPKILPAEYMDLTNDIVFRISVIDYVKASDTVRDLIKIPKLSTAEWWLENTSNSSKGYDMTIKFFDESYFLQVRYYKDYQRTILESNVLWTINIITIAAWVLFAVQALKPLRALRMEGNNGYETSSSATRAQRISMWLLLALGLVSIPLGFALWITLPPLGTPEYVQVGPLRQSIGMSLYGAGFLFLSASLLYTKYKAYFNYIIPTLFISGVTLIVLGGHLMRSFQTYIYEPVIWTGSGLVSGGLFDLICSKRSKKGRAKID